jgi:hypothetical protein
MHPKGRESLERLLDLFQHEEELPTAVAQATVIERQNIGAPSESWSLGNRLIMVAHGTSDARAFGQWKEVGRYPKKGSKAFHLLKPLTRKARDSEAGGASDEAENKRVVYGFGSFPVFRYEDTEGEPVEHPDYSPVAVPPLYEVAGELGVSVDYAPFVEKRLGFYQPRARRIMLHSHDERVFFHELGHAADDRASGPLKGGSDPEQEMIAELVAATLCVMYGFEGYLLGSKRYVEHYGFADATQQGILRVLSRVGKALDVILDHEHHGVLVHSAVIREAS